MKSPKRLMVNRGGTPEKVSQRSPCAILDTCGACTHLALEYKDSLTRKTEHLKFLLRNAGPEFSEIPVKDCTPSPRTLAYRYSAKLVVGEEFRGRDERWIKIGLYRPGSHDLVDVGRCPVQADAINKVVAYLRGAIRQFDIPVFNEKKKTGLLRYVLVRASENTKQCLVTFVTFGKGEKTQLRAMARDLAGKFTFVEGVLQHIHDVATNSIFQQSEDGDSANSNTVVLTGTNVMEEEIAELKLRISATSFFQTNPAVAELLYFRIAELAALNRTETAVDLYCGVGGITLTLAKSAARVVGIDEVGSSISDASHNAKLNNLGNVQFLQGQVEKTLPELISQGGAQAVSVVTLNPARGGCEASVLKEAAKLRPRAMIYMSCYPETLIRDLKVLSQENYRAVALECFDMFPGTHHYEVLAYILPK